ncbi:molybdopterin-synthase adenylyltransferase MoeB [Thiomonas sp.]|uniref:HesA/MoeB/ThiF family protein n=1 Tax=Thiomonas sp. TaxID=2047785 RepID=UPI002638969B|nr:molybdopterin-synthase adenylyltransferase MoeB [Thiomonas sp.]
MDDAQLLRYSRHILLDEIGVEGQERIGAGRALILGAGGLGSPAALYLASAGVGQITLVDDDRVDLTNLQRQIAHTEARIGLLKVDSAREAMRQINPTVEVRTLAQRADEAQLSALVQAADVVLDCSDNFSTRHALNRACVAHGVPLVSGAAIRLSGQVSVFDTRADADGQRGPCYACLFPPDAPVEEVRCATMGVLAPLVGLVGSLQAVEALKLLAQTGTTLRGRLLLIDALDSEFQTLALQRNPRCPVCGSLG